jgi:hypothetical protein
MDKPQDVRIVDVDIPMGAMISIGFRLCAVALVMLVFVGLPVATVAAIAWLIFAP